MCKKLINDSNMRNPLASFINFSTATNLQKFNNNNEHYIPNRKQYYNSEPDPLVIRS